MEKDECFKLSERLSKGIKDGSMRDKSEILCHSLILINIYMIY